MKLARLVLTASLLAPAVAAAQPGYGPGYPPRPQGYYAQPSGVPGGFHERAGRLMWGVGLGAGGMSVNGTDVRCDTCDYNPLAFAGDVHVGGTLSPRLALMLDVQGNSQPVDVSGGYTTSLTQVMTMAAAQYWVTPQLWIKGGLGVATLTLDQQYQGELVGQSAPSKGTAAMVGAGYEVLSSRTFAVDVQARLATGTYNGTDDHVSTGSVGVGLSWY